MPPEIKPLTPEENRQLLIAVAVWVAMMAVPAWWFETIHGREKKERETAAGRGRQADL